MASTRTRLLNFLRSHPPSTAIDLSRILKMSPANVRHHLAILRKQGRVEVISARATHGRGRPRQLFRLTRAENNLDRLSDALLKQFVPTESQEISRVKFFKQVARSLAGKEAIPAGNLPQKLMRAVQRLSQLNYHARWEAHAEGPQLILGHCPYRAIIEDHPELCQIDQQLIQHLTGIPAIQLAKLAENPLGEPLCVFALSETV